ncbi:hypothetical protein ZIOFF_065505 [Zingiber officinale]|uniref:Uncharacterized protein n=1 Tax=Zingiber officinale TaxID=94328 RepID=A0A8J5KBH9_ZINOF|nr:hypothetical protein ZIOFF_065505 [Zingiber officinale]
MEGMGGHLQAVDKGGRGDSNDLVGEQDIVDGQGLGRDFDDTKGGASLKVSTVQINGYEIGRRSVKPAFATCIVVDVQWPLATWGSSGLKWGKMASYHWRAEAGWPHAGKAEEEPGAGYKLEARTSEGVHRIWKCGTLDLESSGSLDEIPITGIQMNADMFTEGGPDSFKNGHLRANEARCANPNSWVSLDLSDSIGPRSAETFALARWPGSLSLVVQVVHHSIASLHMLPKSAGMGAGGRMTVQEQEEAKEATLRSGAGDKPLHRAPIEKPPFTLGQIKKAIPPHCFQRSVLRSFSYVVYDLILSGTFLYFALAVVPQLPTALAVFSWPLYWAAQGCVLTGVWVIAHECGHHAFSDYSLLDDVVGLVLHSALLVPYFSWKYSHRRHHSNTGSMERDEVFVPKQKTALPLYAKYINNPPGRLLSLAVTLTLGWPLYLAFNVSGRAYPRFACHFDPYGPIYSDRERAQIFVSDAGLLIAAITIFRVAATYGGFWWLVRVYGVPLLIVNAWLVIITYLQHTHPALPHYDSTEWDWLRGALATVDRDYGILNRVFHSITDTHVAHHLFSTMPHYHAMEATKAIKPVLGEYYQFDGTPLLKAMWREARECIYVEADAGKRKGVFWYRKEI